MSTVSNQPNSDISTPHKRTHRYTRLIAIVALLLALLSFLLRGFGSSQGSASPTATPTICATGAPGAAGDPGLSAYELWLAMGNTGTVENFLKSLVGQPGAAGASGKVTYYGSDGVTGATGSSGLSAYQLWLNSGKTGTEQDFLNSLLGAGGAAGANGLSAYDLWISNGNTGTEADFFNELAGVDGTNGTDGIPGLSAYQIWLDNGSSGTEGQFLASLVGPAGAEGAQGLCGPAGDPGDQGDSAYQVWINAGNVGSEAVYLASLKGATGATGPRGPTGPPGASGFGLYGSFYDMTDQALRTSGTPQAWTFSNVTGASYGVSIESNGSANTRITFKEAGWYNISFSTVFSKSNSNAADVDIWFAENGRPISDSNTRVTVAGQAQSVAAWNYFYHCTDPRNYLEVMWYTADGRVQVEANDSATSPNRPAVPSIILTVNQIGQ
jgi:hypothetical protein